MSNKVTGVLGKIFGKPYNGKTLYSLKLENDSKWYGLGTKNPDIAPGSIVEFEAKTNPKGFTDVLTPTLVVVRGPQQTVSTGSTVAQVASNGHNGSGRNGFLSKDSYWDRKEARDLKQDELREIGATRNTAIEWIKLLLDKEAIKLPTKIADKEAFLQKLLQDYVERFRAGGTKTTEEPDALASKDHVVAAAAADAVMVGESDAWN
jgi:hypothetical protein